MLWIANLSGIFNATFNLENLAQIIPAIVQCNFYFQAHKLHLGQTLRICLEAHNDGDIQAIDFKERSSSSTMHICWFNMQSDQTTLKYLWVPWIISFLLFSGVNSMLNQMVFRCVSPIKREQEKQTFKWIVYASSSTNKHSTCLSGICVHKGCSSNSPVNTCLLTFPYSHRQSVHHA